VKVCPAWLLFDPSDSPRRTVITVPAGITVGATGAAGVLSFARGADEGEDAEDDIPDGAGVAGAAEFELLPSLVVVGVSAGLLQEMRSNEKIIARTDVIARERMMPSSSEFSAREWIVDSSTMVADSHIEISLTRFRGTRLWRSERDWFR